ncbi:MAG: hypothetical protein VYC64_12940 [Candidatus Latescibacterota bacterium]|nr:hypothetical protein [Candidatus Latescibacterota bacterium]MEE3043590.1 hypothetical protein [Candidatus Latescibacterota bacterium]MEE3262461.1 hypothetical protein [Candidatus Latescibacterota bacterium]MEE3338858.1 hypothetical protein [Candidatus Latescibacterota bacterium]
MAESLRIACIEQEVEDHLLDLLHFALNSSRALVNRLEQIEAASKVARLSATALRTRSPASASTRLPG